MHIKYKFPFATKNLFGYSFYGNEIYIYTLPKMHHENFNIMAYLNEKCLSLMIKNKYAKTSFMLHLSVNTKILYNTISQINCFLIYF